MTPDAVVLQVLRPYSDLSDAEWQTIEKAVATHGIAGLSGFHSEVLTVAKRKFGSRSAAGAYAANMRWARDRGGQGEGFDERLNAGDSVTHTVNGSERSFALSETTAGDLKVGDVFSGQRDKRPRVVVSDVRRTGDPAGKRSVVVEPLGGDKRRRETLTVDPDKKVLLWTDKNPQPVTPRFPNGKIGMSRISEQDRTYLRSAKGTEMMRRRKEVIQRYADKGVDVTESWKRVTSERGQKTWLDNWA